MDKDFNSFLDYLTTGFVEFLPRLVLAIFVFIIGYLVGRFVKRIVNRFILYLNEKLNQQLQINMLNVDLKRSATFISSALFWIIFIFTFLFCIQILRLDFLSTWFDSIVRHLPNLLAAIIIVFVGIIGGRLLGDLIQSATARTGFANGIFLAKVVRYLILFVAIVIAVNQIGIDIAFVSNLFIVIISALLFGAALAFALGAKTSVSNILGSHYARKTHQLGMKIRIGDVEGTIVKITDHAISVETKNGLMVIPAKEFTESKVLIIKDNTK